MLKSLPHRAGWLLATILFLTIAWATSVDDPIAVNNLPLSARAEEDGIWIKNESEATLTGLNLVLNGIFSKDSVSLAPAAELRIPFQDFTDRNKNPYPLTEKPYSLEVFQNGSGNQQRGGYAKFLFD